MPYSIAAKKTLHIINKISEYRRIKRGQVYVDRSLQEDMKEWAAENKGFKFEYEGDKIWVYTKS
jgi:hypothetical protein